MREKKTIHIETVRDRDMFKIQRGTYPVISKKYCIQISIYSHDQVYTCRGKLYIDRQKQFKIYRGKTEK